MLDLCKLYNNVIGAIGIFTENIITMKKIILIAIALICLFNFNSNAQQGVVYVTDQNGEPWGSQSQINAMNTVFGNGGWTTSYYQNANAQAIFSNANCFVYVEGGQNNDTPMNNFTTANQALMQTWVQNGGHLFLNSAGWNSDINCGFGGVTITLNPAYIYASAPGAVTVGQGGHPIFNNGLYPSGASWTGNYFSHDVINGPSGTNLITCTGAQGNQIGLTELQDGCGIVLFGGMTSTSWHSPQPDADNLLNAIYDYMTPCVGQPISCPTYISPANHSIEPNCLGPVMLSWNGGGAGCGADSIHFLLSNGTDNPPTNVYNQLDIGNVNFYILSNPPLTFVPGQTYYWKIELIGYGGGVNGGDTTLICNTIWDYTLQGPPAAPGPINGNLNICQGASEVYSVPNTPGVLYTWTVPAGSTIANGQGTNTITVTVGATSGNICVTASDACGTSPQVCIPVVVSPLPVMPCPINGSTTFCPNINLSYSCLNLPGVVYNWTVPAGWVINSGQGTDNITVTTGNASGNICVTASNICGVSPPCCIPVVLNPNIVIGLSNDTTICFGGQATLTASGAATYVWSPATGLNTTVGATVIATPAVTTKYYVIGDSNGCTGTDSVTVTVSQPIVLSTTQVDVSCPSGTNGTATVNVVSGGIAPFNYSWNSNPIQLTQTASNLPAGTYTVTVTDGAGCNNTINVTILQPSAFVVITDSLPTLCNGGADGSATVTSVTGGNAPYAYSWNSNPVQLTQTATNLPAGNYTVTITDAIGCSVTAIVVVTEPTAVTVTPSSNVTICIGQNANLTALAQGGTPTYTYLWNPGALPGANQVVAPLVTTVYTVIATDANGCASAPQTVTVTVNLPITVICSNDTTICLGTTANLRAFASGGDGNLTYNWVPAGGGFPNPNVQPQVTTTYYCTVNDGCGSPSKMDSVIVTVIQPATVNFTSNITNGCTPVCVNFTDQSVAAAGSNIAAWLWNFGDGSTSNQQNPNHCFTPGTFDITLTVTDNFGCSTTKMISSMISSYAYPIAQFAYGPQPTDILSPNIIFGDKSVNAVKWHWNFGDFSKDSTSELQNPLHEYGDTGRFCVTLMVTSAQNCVDTTIHCLIVNDAFTLFIPNAFTPNGDLVNDYFMPKGKGIKSDGFEMYIYDRWGNMIFKTIDFTGSGWNGTIKGGSEIALQDVYVYKIIAVDITDKKHSFTGDVTLVR